MYGGLGNDILYGSVKHDHLYGDNGKEQYYLEGGDDIIYTGVSLNADDGSTVYGGGGDD